MKEIRKALKPVRKRLRCLNLWRGVGYGVLSAGLIYLGIMICSFLVPIRCRAELIGAAAASALCIAAFIFLLLPVKDMTAARSADARGLKERAQTALFIAEDSAMSELLRNDAVAALNQFDARCIGFPSIKRQCLIAAAVIVLGTALIFVPNPQEAVIKSAIAFEHRMEEEGERLQAEAERPMSGMTEKDRQELRKLLEELRRDIREADEPMEVMLALGNAEQRLESMRERMAGEAAGQLSDALNSNGLQALAEAMESGDAQLLEEALEGIDAQALADASQQLSGDMQGQLGAAARAMQSGNPLGALASLAQMQSSMQSGSVPQLGSVSQLLSSVRSAAGAGGQGGNQGGNGQGNGGSVGNQPSEGTGSGAGKGSTNLGQEGSHPEQAGQRGNGDPRYREGEYESIYDPERLDASHTELSAQSPQGEGDSMQAQLGPGAGKIGESVPYNYVIYDYAEAAVRAADSQNLTAQERSWVNSYFASLTE